MGDTLVRVEGVGKKFCKTLKHNMLYGAADLIRSFLGLGQDSERLRDGEFWALENVSFELKRGESLGLIGPNGAGKSTLLKILNGIIAPDKGRVEISGRVGALIEVGAGFHPMLTGRENIYVNGSILGLSKKEIDRKFDDIVEFAEIGEFIDSPVKHYSSGMYVRLGFAIAAQLEPDIFLIDEVLAVGDVGFRGKCYKYIASTLRKSAVIFVSHNMALVSKICTSSTVLHDGVVSFSGPTDAAVLTYESLFSESPKQMFCDGITLKNFSLSAYLDKQRYILQEGKSLSILFEIEAEKEHRNCFVHVDVLTAAGEFVAEWNSKVNLVEVHISKGRNAFNIEIPSVKLNPGLYFLSLVITSESYVHNLLWSHKGICLEVIGSAKGDAPYQLRGRMARAEV
jgi:lipopolysaccharide transport system ATP-binding protein